MKASPKFSLCSAVILLVTVSNSPAALISVGSATRYASVSSAELGGTLEPGNPNSSADINSMIYDGTPPPPSPTPTWVNNGGITSAPSGVGSNGSLLSIQLNPASVGFGNNGTNFGTWSLTSNFWDVYGSGVLTFHIGNGGGSPDGFAFLLTPGLTTGTFSITGDNGWSNVHLWTSTDYDTPPPSGGGGRVPDGGTTLVSLGVALLGLGSVRRFFTVKA